ncbi:MAG: TlpA family protein disulfide reductase [Bacteroidetes bacterium]|nr:TlpA family protein disulfide reductase [Bacteroidota bacterium]
MKKSLLLFIITGYFLNTYAQTVSNTWRAKIIRADGLDVVFNIDEKRNGQQLEWVIKNAEERIVVKDFRQTKDSLLVAMPFFGAELFLKKTASGFAGQWKKAGSKGDIFMPIEIKKGTYRYQYPASARKFNLTGRWRASFVNAEGKQSDAIGELKQLGNKLTGSILTTTGDYRFLEGVANGDSLVMSTFDGTHAFYFSASINKEGALVNGVFASGATSIETWNATRDANIELDETDVLMRVKEPAQQMNFSFPDLDGKMVSISDDRFKNKVVVIQIMGSWCPNCMDETAFLSKYYNEHPAMGMEVIGLAYEYSTDFEKARTSLMRFKNKFNVQYPILITGVTSNDPLRTEKTLPKMTSIKAFPSMIILGKDGQVKKTHAGYSGPATGIHHEKFKQEFDELIRKLVKE